MNDIKTKNSSPKSSENQLDAQLQGGVNEDSIDEELLALAPPPPSVQQAIFIIVIIAFSFMLLYLFWPELRYFMKGFSDPVTLGEAADLKNTDLKSDSFVKVDGVPLVNRTVTFSTGTKWFSGDIYRKMAPISGNPNLLVQWHTNNPNIKQTKDTLTPPSAFAGRLKRREDLSKNYNKFWPFYDCLRLHSTSQCKFCIGKTDLAECRSVFTCVDNYPIEVCDQTAFYTREEIQEKVQKLKTEIQRQASSDLVAEMQLNEKALAALDNIDVLANLVTIEEMFDRVDMLPVSGDRKSDAFALKKKIFNLLVEALEIKLRHPLEKMASLSPALRIRLETVETNLAAAQKALSDVRSAKAKLKPLVDVNTEFAEFVELIREIQENLHRVTEGGDALKDWSLDGSESGSLLLAKVRDLDAKLATVKLAPKTETPSDGKTDASPGSDETDDSATTNDSSTSNSTDDDSSSAAVARIAPPALTTDTDSDMKLTDATLATIHSQLDQAVNRVAEVGRVLIHLTPGEVPEVDKWASSTDIVGSLPKPLRADHVFKHFEQLKKMLAGITPKADTSLKTRYRTLLETENEKEATVQSLSATSGLAELTLVQNFKALKRSVENVKTESQLSQSVDMWRQLNGRFAGEEFYPGDLSNFPKEQKALVALVKRANLLALETEVSALEKTFASPIYVLLDDEKPTDSPWILFVYIVVPFMLIFNIRKLLRFIADWRQHGL
ncbi:MAG: hypothetical protein JXR76_23125 [Deltaproteobacteria bacterium]|nr:hypothetical protein [Deltaproteobacteria bacterium]